jgi:hypothetical protein
VSAAAASTTSRSSATANRQSHEHPTRVSTEGRPASWTFTDDGESRRTATEPAPFAADLR